MGKITLPDNFLATCDGEEYKFRADTDRQAWYLAYEYFDAECLDSLVEIDEYGVPIRELLDRGD